MVLKPIPLASLARFVPPVTGVNGSLAPVANVYDDTGNFQSRGRAGSVKRKRVDEVDAVFDLSQPYPPLNDPPKLKLDLSVAKDLVVAAGVAGGEVRTMLEDPALYPKSRVLGNDSLAILSAVEALLESGLVPLSSGTQYVAGKSNKPLPPAATGTSSQ
jgi:hypothetical protein